EHEVARLVDATDLLRLRVRVADEQPELVRHPADAARDQPRGEVLRRPGDAGAPADQAFELRGLVAQELREGGRHRHDNDALAEAAAPLTVAELRRACRMRTSTLCAILSDLVMEGRVRRTAAGYLPAGRWRFLPRVSRVSLQRAGNGNGKSIGKRDWDAINERAHAHIPKNPTGGSHRRPSGRRLHREGRR